MNDIDINMNQPPKTVKDLYRVGVEIFGSYDKFMKWAKTPSTEYNVRRIDLLFNENEDDLKKVYDLLWRIKHNIN